MGMNNADARAAAAKAMDRLEKAQRRGQAAHDREADRIAAEMRREGHGKAAGIISGLRGKRGK